MFLNRLPKRLLYLFGIGLAIRLFLAWLPQEKLFYLISDDAYYYFSIAKNLVSRGILSADGIHQTNGFHPLWLFVITPFFLLFKAFPWFCIHLAITAAAVFDTAAGYFIYKTLERLGKPNVGFWAAFFYLFNPYGLLHTLNGLETAQNNFFLALLVYLSVRATPEWLKSGWLLLGSVCGLALLSRTDNILVVAALLFFLLWKNRGFTAVAKTVVPAALLFLPWLVFNHLTFGTVVQTSGTAYPFHYHQQYLNEYRTYFSPALVTFLAKLGFHTFAENAYHYGNWMLSLLVVGAVFPRLKNLPEKYRLLLWSLLGAGLFISFHTFVRWSVRPWYPQAVFVLTLPLVTLALEKLNRYVLAAGMALCLFMSGLWLYSSRFRVVDRSLLMLDWINQKIPSGDRVGVFNSGFAQFFTDRRVINLDGLVNNEVLSFYRQKNGLEYLRQKNIRWLLDTPTYLGGLFGPYFGPLAESSLTVVEQVTDIAYPRNNLFLVAVFPDSQTRAQGTPMPVWREWAARRKWEKVPSFFLKR